MQDALVFGGACISLLNHADRVKIACLAQLVNAIAPIMTETGGPAWRQTIFFPFADMANLGRGQVLRAKIDSPTYAASYYDPRGTSELHFPMDAVPYLKLSAVYNADGGHVTIFALNRKLDEPMPLDIAVRGFEGLSIVKAHQLHHANLKAVNDKDAPEQVKPISLDSVKSEGGRITAELTPASWNVIRVAVRDAV